MLQKTEAHLIITQRTNLLLSSPKHQNICYKLHLLYIIQLKKKALTDKKKLEKKITTSKKKFILLLIQKKKIAKILF